MELLKNIKKSNLRKPNTGMFKKIDKIWNVDKKKSFMIGDQKTDMEFAKKSKIRGFKFKSNNLYCFVKNINFIKKYEKKIIKKPWGYEELISHNKNYVLKKLFMKKVIDVVFNIIKKT